MSDQFEAILAQAQQGDPAAQHQLALEYARRGQMTRARRWLRSAAELQHADAINELALMALHGVGEAADSGRALELLLLADQAGSGEASYQLATLAYTRGLPGLGEERAPEFLQRAVTRDFPAALRVMGMLLLADPERSDQAQSLLLRAAHRDDPLAQHTVGAALWQAGDHQQARHWLEQAAAKGAYVSQQLLNGVDSTGSSGTAPTQAAPSLPALQDWQWPEARAFEATSLFEGFPAFSIEGVLTQAECEYLINIANPMLRRSATIDPATGKPTLNELRTSSSMNFDASTQDIVLEWIEHRLAATAGQPVSHGEPLSILRYRPGEEYQPHYDYIPLDSAEAQREFASRGQRLVTIFTYLSDVRAGGGTDFPELDVQVPAVQGNAVMFHNCDAQQQPDPRSLHAGMPVIEGEKWLAVLWLRDRPWADEPGAG